MDQSEEEQEFAFKFLSHIKDVEFVCRLDPPDPDFLINQGSKSIGLELTNIIGQSELMISEGNLTKYLAKAKQLFELKYGYFIECSFSIGQLNMSKTKFEEHIESYLHVIDGAISPFLELEYKTINIDNMQGQSDLPNEINHLRITHSKHVDSSSSWHRSGMFFIPEIEEKRIDEALDRKEKRYEAYSQNVDEVWLLIYESMNLGTWNTYDKGKQFDLKKCSFDRVYLMPFHEEPLRLK